MNCCLMTSRRTCHASYPANGWSGRQPHQLSSSHLMRSDSGRGDGRVHARSIILASGEPYRARVPENGPGDCCCRCPASSHSESWLLESERLASRTISECHFDEPRLHAYNLARNNSPFPTNIRDIVWRMMSGVCLQPRNQARSLQQFMRCQ